ncbi:uncharacterized protein BCR38DRAFT_488982 [Pseudomassariella vexata]|uniref:Uncharacterized protein n=1 Tax=Pseudomassariella vexata TaxID=1141098 RepID=A0A1Y2DJ46_9PEZI|nr:uncharacterized protein BCR38DRAFT_488982 [Pseudomassariella vexata]ORY59251.1 hypothetical protein BCR38DRAFT_488982 [Pseudomassariella vexata]
MSEKLAVTTSNTGPRFSRYEECEEVYDTVDQWRKEGSGVLIPIVRNHTVPLLEQKCKRPWWELLKRSKSIIRPSTVDGLKEAIAETCEKPTPMLFMLISRHVDLGLFDIPATVGKLAIIRCGQREDRHRQLRVSGLSTFCGIRLDQWEIRRVRKHAVILGPGVVIQLHRGMPWGQRKVPLTADEEAKAYQNLKALLEKGVNSASEAKTNVKHLKSTIAALLSLLIGAGRIVSALRVTPEGVTLSPDAIPWLKMGAVKVASGFFKLANTAGTPVVAGASVTAVAAAMYFIPWDTLWAWLRAKFSSALDKLRSAFTRLCTMIRDFFLKKKSRR